MDNFDCYLKLPDEIYLRKYDNDTKIGEEKPEKIEITEDGIFLTIKGTEHIFKGYSDPRIVRAVGVVKKLILCGFRFLSATPYLIPIAWLFRKRLTFEFASFSHRVLRDYYFKPQYYIKSGQEIYKVMDGNFDLAMCIVMIWEFDDTYRFRGQFALGQINWYELRKNPKKELKRVLDILAEREQNEGMKGKWRAIKKVISFLPIKKFSEILQELDLSVMLLDEDDKYFAGLKGDFNY